MNTNILYGLIAFLAWSAFCTWHYTCNIQGLCFDQNLVTEENMEPVPISSPISETIDSISDSTTSVAVIELPTIDIVEDQIYFKINSTEFFNPNYIVEFIEKLKTDVDGRATAITIEGYTCDLGAEPMNQKLGLERASAIKKLLTQKGISSENLEIISKGEIPSINNTSDERQKNRKVIITIKSTDQ